MCPVACCCVSLDVHVSWCFKFLMVSCFLLFLVSFVGGWREILKTRNTKKHEKTQNSKQIRDITTLPHQKTKKNIYKLISRISTLFCHH